jgi:alkanesulfonate monooxygenase SsuD/methylene tetrahydromethanopterin reductase-like flavin-dependent oxidoreductase (luciferase family)
MPHVSLRYDLRAPAFGVSQDVLARAVLEQVEWADARGFERVWVAEHHASDDGYCPSPLILASAVAARTRKLRIQTAVLILPLYHPIKLAEDVAVLDQISGGRFDLGVGVGYRADEYAMFGKDLHRRPSLMEDGIRTLKSAWTGEPFEFQGATVRVRPQPLQLPHPPILIGGSSEVAARRAARLGDGFNLGVPTIAGDDAQVLIDAYHDERERLGLDRGWVQTLDGPVFFHVTLDPDRAWARAKPFLANELESYDKWARENGQQPKLPADPDVFRAHGLAAMLTPEECIQMWRGIGPDASITLNPMIGGLPPDLAWESLELFADKVLPQL